jgi:hypothetical protein
MLLAGGALASKIVWVATGAVTANAGAHIEGVILGQTSISMLTGATANSRLLAQTAIALQQVCSRTYPFNSSFIPLLRLPSTINDEQSSTVARRVFMVLAVYTRLFSPP